MKEKNLLQPLGTRLVVEPDEFKYEGRIVIPEKNQSTPTIGTVVAIGPLVDTVAVGDRVLYAHYSGTLIKISKRPAYRILTQEELLAKILTDDTLEYTAA